MAIAGGRVAVVGGSIAGCAAAIALTRAGCDVTIYERSPSVLRDRGFGIGLPVPLHQTLVSAGYLDAAMPVHRGVERLWTVRDADRQGGGSRDAGRIVFRQPYPVVLANWGIIWRTLHRKLDGATYRRGVAVARVEGGESWATVVTAGGARERFDLVVGTDGYRSMVRTLVAPENRPAYAGYVLWRGAYRQARLAAPIPEVFDGAGVMVCFPGGHGLFYAIPDFAAGDRRLNWAIYGGTGRPLRVDGVTSLPPGSVRGEFADLLEQILSEHFPPYWAAAVRRTHRHEIALQPIYDVAVSAYTAGRLLLAGDAGALPRPHAAAGATKALEDALTLERACREHGTWEGVLAAYDDERCPAGNAVVEVSRRLGRAQVEDTPPWSAMTADDFRTWWDLTLAGRRWPGPA
jgi:2-polyprenyl-6-methoxyphenol hydroxylase-like FAD-dependent oxidoreductase